jgi:hypothetical protein
MMTSSSSSSSSIYLDDTARAWLDHLPKNSNGRGDYLKEIFTGNIQGTYVRPVNLWV